MRLPALTRPAPHGASLVRELRAATKRSAAVLVLLLLAMLAVTSHVLGVLQPRLQDYTSVTRELRVNHEAVLDQETGLRAWLATGDRRFLQPYEAGAVESRAAQQRLRRHLDVDDRLSGHLVEVMLTQQAWQQAWAQPALDGGAAAVAPGPVAGGSGPGSPDRAALLLEGEQRFDVYRAAYRDAVDASAAGRDAAVRQQRTALQALVGSQVLLGATGLVVVLRRSRRVLGLVEAPVHVLQGAIERVRRGEALDGLPDAGLQEFEDVTTALVELSQGLDRERAASSAQQLRAERAGEQLEEVVRVGQAMAACPTTDALATLVVGSSAQLSGGRPSLWLRAEPGTYTCAAWSGSRRPDESTGSLVHAVAADGRRRVGDDQSVIPLIGSGQVLAVLHLVHPPQRTGPDTGETALEALLVSATAHLEAVALHEATRARASTDQLTGLANRRQMDEELAVEWARSTRHGRPLSLGMVDLDHFKQINDGAGHLTGDLWLKLVAEVIGGQVRSHDRVFRYGGEEIAVLLPETAEKDAATVLERIRVAIENVRGPEAVPHVTASFGVAELRPGMLEPADLIEAADRALYAAKRAGRNLVVRSGLVEPVPAAGS